MASMYKCVGCALHKGYKPGSDNLHPQLPSCVNLKLIFQTFCLLFPTVKVSKVK